MSSIDCFRPFTRPPDLQHLETDSIILKLRQTKELLKWPPTPIAQARMNACRAEKEAHLAEEAAREAFACRRCSAKFASNIKLHEHVRDHHTKSAPPTPPAPLALKLSLSAIQSIETPPSTPPTKFASTSKAAPLKMSLSAITNIQIAPVSFTPSPKAASSSKAASPLTPPATSPKTWAAVVSKSAPKSASAVAPLTSFSSPAQTSPQPLKPYLTVDDLYRMFHLKKRPHQTHITTFFKPVRRNQRNTLPTTNNTTKTQALFPTSSASLSRQTATFQLRKSTSWSFRRYVSGLPLKMAPEKRLENTSHTAPPTNGTTAPTRPNYYGVHTKTSAGRRRHLEGPRRWYSAPPRQSPFSKKVASRQNSSFTACIVIRRFWSFNRRLISTNTTNRSLLLLSLTTRSLLPRGRGIFSKKVAIVMDFIQGSLDPA